VGGSIGITQRRKGKETENEEVVNRAEYRN
jgi:hypothetical protein